MYKLGLPTHSSSFSQIFSLRHHACKNISQTNGSARETLLSETKTIAWQIQRNISHEIIWKWKYIMEFSVVQLSCSLSKYIIEIFRCLPTFPHSLTFNHGLSIVLFSLVEYMKSYNVNTYKLVPKRIYAPEWRGVWFCIYISPGQCESFL